MQKRVDVVVTEHGTIVAVLPASAKARRYTAKHHADAIRIGDAIAVEHGYAFDVLTAMVAAGLRVQRASDGAIAQRPRA